MPHIFHIYMPHISHIYICHIYPTYICHIYSSIYNIIKCYTRLKALWLVTAYHNHYHNCLPQPPTITTYYNCLPKSPTTTTYHNHLPKPPTITAYHNRLSQLLTVRCLCKHLFVICYFIISLFLS